MSGGLFGGEDDFSPNMETTRQREREEFGRDASPQQVIANTKTALQQNLAGLTNRALAACGVKGREQECDNIQNDINRLTQQLNGINERGYNQQVATANATITRGSTATNLKKPITMDITRLISPQVKADALERINRITQQLRDSLAVARDNQERAKASIYVGGEEGVGCAQGWDFFKYGCGSCPSHKEIATPGGLICYNKCPATHPHRIDGMPYLCAQSPHAYDAIRRQAEWDFISKDDTAAAIDCAEATLNRDQARIEEKCGFSAAAKWKAIGEKIASGIVSYITLGVSDIVAAARGRTANEDLFGHKNRGGDDGAAQQHLDGVVRAFITIKDLATEEACVKAIDESDMVGYMNYCPLTYPATPPYEKDAQGNDIKFHGLTPPIDPNADLTGGSWADDFVYGAVDDSEVPPVGFDESRLPKFPDDLLQSIPDRFYPDPEKEDMVPPAWPADLKLNANEPLSDKSKPPREIEWNILDKPNSLLVLGGFLLAILSITS